MKQQQGFSLIEVLVTMIIISFGLLGIAGVIVNSLRNNQSSYARTQASVMANDIIDRMRANRITAEASPSPYAFDNLTATVAPTGAGVPLADLTEWSTSLARAMPSGAGSVAINAATKVVTVTVQWNDARASGSAVTSTTTGKAAQQVVVQTRL